MGRRAQENLIALCLLAFFIGIIVLSMDYSPRARFVPLPMAVLGALLVLVQIAWQNTRSIDELQVDVLEMLTGHARSKEEKGNRTPDPHSAFKHAVAFGMVALLLAGFVLLGPIPSIFLFTAGYLILTGYFPWPKGLVYAAVLTVIVVVVFGYILKIPLDRSVLLPGITHYIGL
jgi:hypothetical protein